MIFVKPSTTFEATASGFITGLTGTIGVRVMDGQGATSVARTTSGIVESPSGSGIYTATLTAPVGVGQYEVVWDDAGSPTTWATEDLTVTSSGSVPFAQPSRTFEATASGFATGLTGTIGVRVVDGQGGTSVPRTTANIVESPSGSGIYTATLTAPLTVGQYEVVWDDAGSPTTWAAEDLTVTSSGAVAGPGVGMTFTELLTEFYARGFNYLEDGGAGEVRAKRFLNQSYQEICGMDDWPFLQANIEGPAPLYISDLGYVESVTDTVAKRNIGFIDRRTLVERYPDLSLAGAPNYAYITGGDTINTYPSNTSPLSVRYLRLVADLSDPTDQPVIPAKYQYAIIDYACGRAYMDSDNPEMAQIVRRDGDALVQQMREQFMVQQHQDADLIVTYGYSSDYR